ncbi:MAG TPA: NusG domain II-containing protein [Fibrobacteria bacterium]|nr:NusG domain II-containing protein [Fibrobacteria bacterium]
MFRPRSFFRPLDALLAVSVATAAVWGFLAFRVADGSRAVVYIGNRKYGWYDVAGAPRRVTVPTRIGEVSLEIGNGSARVAASPCRNKVCMRTGAIHRAHSEIVCMPAQLLIVLESDRPRDGDGKSPGGTDAVTY